MSCWILAHSWKIVNGIMCSSLTSFHPPFTLWLCFISWLSYNRYNIFLWLRRGRDCDESALLIFPKESFALKNDSWLWWNQKIHAHSHYNLAKMTHEIAIFFLVLIDSILIDSWVAIIKKGEIVVLYVLMMRQHGLIIWHVLMMR